MLASGATTQTLYVLAVCAVFYPLHVSSPAATKPLRLLNCNPAVNVGPPHLVPGNTPYTTSLPGCQCLGLAQDDGHHGVYFGLEPSTSSECIQPSVPLESPVQPLNSHTPIVDRLPLWCLHRIGYRLSMTKVGVDDWLCPVLSFNQPPQLSTGVGRITDNKLRMELGVGETSLTEYVGSPLGVMDVSRAYDHRYRQLVSRISQYVRLETPDVFPVSFRVGLHAPTGVRVGDLPVLTPLATVRPSFDVRAVYSHGFPKAWQRIVQPTGQIAENVLDQERDSRLSQLGAESRESRLTGNVVGGIVATSPGYERVVMEEPNQIRDGIQAQVVVGDERPPEFDGFVPWSATTPWAFERREENFIGEFLEDCLKLGNDWGNLSIRNEYSNIWGGHREVAPSLWQGAVGVDAPAAPLYLEQVYYQPNALSIENDERTLPISYEFVR